MEENHRYYREGHLASASAPSRHLASLRYFLSAPLHVAAAAAVAGTACGRRVCPSTILDSDAKERRKEGERVVWRALDPKLEPTLDCARVSTFE